MAANMNSPYAEMVNAGDKQLGITIDMGLDDKICNPLMNERYGVGHGTPGYTSTSIDLTCVKLSIIFRMVMNFEGGYAFVPPTCGTSFALRCTMNRKAKMKITPINKVNTIDPPTFLLGHGTGRFLYGREN